MPLGVIVALMVFAVTVLTGVVGYLIDKGEGNGK